MDDLVKIYLAYAGVCGIVHCLQLPSFEHLFLIRPCTACICG